MLFDDQLTQLEADSKKVGTQGGELDFALLVDGLSAEREQGDHDRRRLPLLRDRATQVHRRRHARPRAVHAQHDHRRVDRRSRRDPDRCAQGGSRRRAATHLVALIGIRRVVLAINKMDLVDYDRAVFERIDADYRAFAAELRAGGDRQHPDVALRGDNVIPPSARMPWYAGDADAASRHAAARRARDQRRAVPAAGAGSTART